MSSEMMLKIVVMVLIALSLLGSMVTGKNDKK